MDQLAREDIAAAAAAHHELGRDYDGAVAEGLVERIGAEIDKRVDARLAQRPTRGARLAQRPAGGRPVPAARPAWGGIILGLGSMAFGIGAAAMVLNADANMGNVYTSTSGSAYALVAVIWLIIGVINVAHARRR